MMQKELPSTPFDLYEYRKYCKGVPYEANAIGQFALSSGFWYIPCMEARPHDGYIADQINVQACLVPLCTFLSDPDNVAEVEARLSLVESHATQDRLQHALDDIVDALRQGTLPTEDQMQALAEITAVVGLIGHVRIGRGNKNVTGDIFFRGMN